MKIGFIVLAQPVARASRQAIEFGSAAVHCFREFVDSDNGDLDFSATYRSIRK
ncbi:MAG: hypothetical protein GY875_07760 [Gammaproteobacteria bacterium]|nr:hypothetical protein [Gammaproteobacteria bacterium]